MAPAPGPIPISLWRRLRRLDAVCCTSVSRRLPWPEAEHLNAPRIWKVDVFVDDTFCPQPRGWQTERSDIAEAIRLTLDQVAACRFAELAGERPEDSAAAGAGAHDAEPVSAELWGELQRWDATHNLYLLRARTYHPHLLPGVRRTWQASLRKRTGQIGIDPWAERPRLADALRAVIDEAERRKTA